MLRLSISNGFQENHELADALWAEYRDAFLGTNVSVTTVHTATMAVATAVDITDGVPTFTTWDKMTDKYVIFSHGRRLLTGKFGDAPVGPLQRLLYATLAHVSVNS